MHETALIMHTAKVQVKISTNYLLKKLTNSLKLRFLGENIIFILFQAFSLLSLCYYVLCVVLLLPNDCCWSLKN